MPFIDIFAFCLTDAKLSFEPGQKDVIEAGNKFWIFMREFIKKFDPEGLKLVVHSSKNIAIHENLNDALPPLPDLGFEIIKSSACIEDILYNLLRTLHPPTLSIISPFDSNFPKEGTGGKKKSLIVGPWGGNGGNSWDDGTFTGVREITLVYDRCIDSIRVVYDKHGKPFTAEKHGGVGGNKTAEIKLQYPDEFLMGVSGHYCPVVRGGTPVIRSLTFKSNRRTFGPYGIEEGIPFTFSIDGGQVVGFKGRGDWYLDSIAFVLAGAQSKSLLQKVQRGLKRLTSTAPKSSSSASQYG